MERRELQIFRKYLERRGLKLTAERQALFDEIFSRHEHVEADELLVRLRAKHKKISRATIYRTLELHGRRRASWEGCGSARRATATSGCAPATTTTT